MESAILQTVKLCKSYSSGGVQQHVLKNLDVSVQAGDFTVIMGNSGSGKSTLLYALSGMDQPTLGKITFSGQSITGLSNDQLAVFRRENCGFVFQQIHLLDNMSVLDNVMAAGLLVHKNRRQVATLAKELLIEVGLPESLWHKFPTQLSGGEAQRASIVRALINQPKILFADEPTGALNSAFGIRVLDVLTAFNRKGQSVVMVTHDLQSALRGNRILYLQDGVICGDLSLEAYDEKTSPARLDQLKTFLAGMGW